VNSLPKIAVFGGTFDPPHIGHVEAILGLTENPGIHRFRIIPAGAPRLKLSSPTASPEQRLQMLRLTFDGWNSGKVTGIDALQIDDREIERVRRSGEPTRTRDTLMELKQTLGTDFAWVIGTDQLAQLHSWFGFPEILNLCHWIVLDRKHTPTEVRHAAENQISSLIQSGLLLSRETTSDSPLWTCSANGKSTFRWVPTSARGISSTEIRADLAKLGNHSRFLGHEVPENLARYLKSQSLYGTAPDA